MSHVLTTCPVLDACTQVCAHICVHKHTLAQSLSCAHIEDKKNDMIKGPAPNTHKQTLKPVGKNSARKKVAGCDEEPGDRNSLRGESCKATPTSDEFLLQGRNERKWWGSEESASNTSAFAAIAVSHGGVWT